MQKPETALTHYSIGTLVALEPIAMGFIHRTWKAVSDHGEFTLQQANPIFASTIMEDIEAVLGYLRNNGCTTMEIVRARDGRLYLDDEGGFWRLFTYIPGKVYEIIDSPKIAYEAGFLLGTYHRLLDEFRYEFKNARSIKKNIPLLYEYYQNAIKDNTNPEIKELIPVIDRMITLQLPTDLRKTVNHGDPKISNFVFSEGDTPRAIAMIDFDDCGRNYNPVLELSSAFRSWSWNKKEGKENFDTIQFEAGLQGYLEGSHHFLTMEERGFILQAIELNVLQLASRFVRDFFEKKYFALDKTKYSTLEEQNLVRAKEHIALYNDIVAKRDIIQEVIHASEKSID